MDPPSLPSSCRSHPVSTMSEIGKEGEGEEKVEEKKEEHHLP